MWWLIAVKKKKKKKKKKISLFFNILRNYQTIFSCLYLPKLFICIVEFTPTLILKG